MILRKYETLFVAKPELADENMETIRTRVNHALEKNGGQLIAYQDWGRKRLAYPIRSYPKGNYLYCRYLGSGTTVFEIERQLKVIDDVLRFMSMMLEDRVESESFDFEAERAGIFPFGVRPREPQEGDRRDHASIRGDAGGPKRDAETTELKPEPTIPEPKPEPTIPEPKPEPAKPEPGTDAVQSLPSEQSEPTAEGESDNSQD